MEVIIVLLVLYIVWLIKSVNDQWDNPLERDSSTEIAPQSNLDLKERRMASKAYKKSLCRKCFWLEKMKCTRGETGAPYAKICTVFMDLGSKEAKEIIEDCKQVENEAITDSEDKIINPDHSRDRIILFNLD